MLKRATSQKLIQKKNKMHLHQSLKDFRSTVGVTGLASQIEHKKGFGCGTILESMSTTLPGKRKNRLKTKTPKGAGY